MTVQIGYESLQDRSGITVASVTAATTYPVENATDWLPYDYYQPDVAGASIQIKFSHASTQVADYFALAKHDLFTLGARVKVEYSADDISYYTAMAYQTLGDNGVFFKSFTQQTGKYWLITIDRSDAATIQPVVGMIALGSVFDVGKNPQVGFEPPIFDNDIGSANDSMTGNFLGKSIKKTGSPMALAFNSVTPTFARTYWIPFMTHLQSKPCFISWNETTYSEDAVLAWTEKGSDISAPNYSSPTFMDLAVKLRAVRS